MPLALTKTGLTLDINVVFAGLLAASYANGYAGKESPSRMWGNAEAFKPITIGDTMYSMTRHRQKIDGEWVPGIFMTIAHDRFNATKMRKEHKFIPYRALHQIGLTISEVYDADLPV